MPKIELGTEVPFHIETQAQALFIGWAMHFKTNDLVMPYTAVETGYFKQLDDDLLVVGIVDAEGPDFFADWKTANPREMKTWKQDWLLSVQALTYGLLTGGERRYLVRKAFKKAVPEYDHEWFEFDPRDLTMWERQIHMIAKEIRELRSEPAPWPLNLKHGCFAYGKNYACPFWQDGCTKHNWTGMIPGELPPTAYPEFQGKNRAVLEKTLHGMRVAKTPIVLSATRIESFLRCREYYRRIQYASFPPGDALLIGTRTHEMLADYYRALIVKKHKGA